MEDARDFVADCFFNFKLREHLISRQMLPALVSVGLRPLTGTECNADREKIALAVEWLI
jgi:hypothetical protein